MLDDLKLIHERDAQDALGVAEKLSEQFLHNFNFKWEPPQPIHEIFVAGMGGSGLAARAYKTIGGLEVPFEVVQDYELPRGFDQNTLIICSSYSGNTEETLSVFEEIFDGDQSHPAPMVVVVASGGQLLDRARELNLPNIQLPTGYQPRYTFGFQYRALTEVISSTSLADGKLSLLESSASWLKEEVKSLFPDISTKNNPAKKMALELVGSSVVIYSGPFLAPAAYKWKININENAKTVAWQGTLPEFNHNEFLGWTSHPIEKPYKIVDLRSNLDHLRVQKRFEVTERLLSGRRPAPEVIEVKGDTPLKQLLWTIQLGDFTSLYLAILNGLNPTPVDLIEKLKASLKE
jgi:glucose/mannose-6-phosphate isomerase